MSSSSTRRTCSSSESSSSRSASRSSSSAAASTRRRLSGRRRIAAAISAGCSPPSVATSRSTGRSYANRSPASLQSRISGARRSPGTRRFPTAIVATSQAKGSGAGVIPTSRTRSPRTRLSTSSPIASRSPWRSSNWRRLTVARRRRTPSLPISPTRPMPMNTRRRPTATTSPLTRGGRAPRPITMSTTWPSSVPSELISGSRVNLEA